MSEIQPTSPFAPPDPNLAYGSTLGEAYDNYRQGVSRSGMITHVPTEWNRSIGQENEDITVPNNFISDVLGRTASIGIGDTIPNPTRVAPNAEKNETILQREFRVGDIGYTIEGKVELDSSRTGYVFSSFNRQGEKTRFFVYRSNSEGSWRSSQGTEIHNGSIRYLKGAENTAPNTQYTQDTQLHPEFEANFSKIIGNEELLPTVDAASLFLDEAHSIEAAQKFGGKESVYRISSEELHHDLTLLPAGEITIEKARASLGIPQQESDREVQTMVMQQIGVINARLVSEGLIPDFDQEASRAVIETHPVLGTIKKETYVHVSPTGAKYEWTMNSLVSDPTSVWIDRVRLAGAGANEYGVDRQKVFSGLLTSKLVEYKSQVTAVPDQYINSVDGSSNYVNMAKFLRMLAPVSAYISCKRATASITEQ